MSYVSRAPLPLDDTQAELRILESRLDLGRHTFCEIIAAATKVGTGSYDSRERLPSTRGGFGAVIQKVGKASMVITAFADSLVNWKGGACLGHQSRVAA